ncbi:MAG: ABC transporter ATP-binding protein [Akkermansia sp.]|nr:ABC transporter ATP-binding protein [Akkermansia muciniphila]MCI7004707.1 ABC transporter ATP-binding protein [Akkermansia muciniphila]MCI7699159.1 ABC transporter ATP-binding protein [Akkermansia sp.]MDD6813747.1 ABC transporter ATP-binding protein [Akkermansia muciniphila]
MIELRNITKVYHLGEIDLPVLKGISLRIEDGEFVSLTGASGSGKSTLMNLLGCLDHPSGGDYFIDGKNVARLNANERALLRNHRIGFVFQNFNLLPRTSALENVMMPAYYHHPVLPTRVIRERALELIRLVGLEERMHHTPAQLSGGQQQRVAIARSLINNPGILLADEPTGNLDSTTSVEVMHMFRDLNRQKGITVIIVTHDPKTAAFTDRAINMVDGLISEGVSDELSATLSK